MFAEAVAALALGAAQLLPVVVPLGKPRPPAAAPIAPIEISGPAFVAACKDSDDPEKPAPPVRIHANTYLVGTCGISSILITGDQGDILIDGGTEADADLIAANIRDLGFNLGDIRYILFSHEHFDHVGGIARLQQLTGAQLVSSAAAAPVIGSGVASEADPQSGMHQPFPAAHVDRVVQDGEIVRLGNILVTAVATPGHTPGAMTWHWGACDGGVCRHIVYADSLNPISRDDYRFSDRPAYLAAFRRSIAKVAALDCDILLTPHPSASDMPDRLIDRAPLTDPDGCRNYAASIAKKLDERLAKERAGK